MKLLNGMISHVINFDIYFWKGSNYKMNNIK